MQIIMNLNCWTIRIVMKKKMDNSSAIGEKAPEQTYDTQLLVIYKRETIFFPRFTDTIKTTPLLCSHKNLKKIKYKKSTHRLTHTRHIHIKHIRKTRNTIEQLKCFSQITNINRKHEQTKKKIKQLTSENYRVFFFSLCFLAFFYTKK